MPPAGPARGVNVPCVKGKGTRSSPSPPYAVVAKLANAPDLDSGGFSPSRFESGLPHALHIACPELKGIPLIPAFFTMPRRKFRFHRLPENHS